MLRAGGVAGNEDGDGDGLENVLEEGGVGRGEDIPDDAAARKKWFQHAKNRERWVWEAGKTYWGDFFNGYLDFNSMWLLFFSHFNPLSPENPEKKFLTRCPIKILPSSSPASHSPCYLILAVKIHYGSSFHFPSSLLLFHLELRSN